MTRDHFLIGVGNWANHRFLLWDALEATQGDVIEMGCGDGSTPWLAQYCSDEGRKLFSYEGNQEWYNRMRQYEDRDFKINLLKDADINSSIWDHVAATHPNPAVVLIDHAPGERRKIDVGLFLNKAQIVVMHDTEPAADHGYQMRQFKAKFKYWVDHKSEGAWASMASNFIDVTKIVTQ